MSIDHMINEWLAPVSEAMSSIVFYTVPLDGENKAGQLPIILVWMMAASLFTTLYFGFINLRYFIRGWKLAFGWIKDKGDEKAEGQITRFQALAATLSGTVGLGNIAGVAIAISIGGPGAVLWMILMGLFGMSTKFLEASLGVHYRQKVSDGHFSGGPMYYLRDGLSEIGLPMLGKILAVIFAVCCIGGAVGAGGMFQVNQVFEQLVTVTGGHEESILVGKGWLFGLGMAVLVGAVILGGIKSIANVAEKIVPAMAILYLLAGFVVLIGNYAAIPTAFMTIVNMALTPEAGLGGLIGAIIQGVRRAVFSNEAGLGSAAIAHSVARTASPVSQGLVAMLGAFIDTVVICLMTALVIVVSGVEFGVAGSAEGIPLTSRAFETVMPWFPPVLAFIVFLFAYSTMLTWSYYGQKAVLFLFGENKTTEIIYKLCFCGFIVLGASASLGVIMDLSDSMYFAMAVPNVIGLYLLAPKVKRMLKTYPA